MKCCVSTDVGTWTNWLTFEPDLDHSLDAATGLLSPNSYRLRNFAALPRLPATAMLRGILRRENPTYTYWRRAVVLKWFYSLSRRITFVGGKCALPSALLVSLWFLQTLTDFYNIWQIIYPVNLQHNSYWFTRLTYVLLLHYLGKKLVLCSCIELTLATKVTHYRCTK